ncbi:MAG: ABC transporter permease [Clostridiales bacterium]|nr:ABC transporter permease [Clostridiales bacterium]
MKYRRILETLVFAIGLILLWQLFYTAGTQWFSIVKPYAVPNPLGVVESFLRLASDGTLIRAVGYSMMRAVIGFCISIVIGSLLGILILQFPFLRRNLKPMILGIQTLPSICWVPFAILWFGLKESAIIFVIVMGSAFSIALAVENGVNNVPPVYIKAAKTMGVTPINMYRKVILPAALPSFVGGLKQGWSFAWRALMSGEVMSASVGLGYTLMIGRDLADINQVMTVMLIIVLLGILIDKGIFSRAENHILRKRGLV